MVLAHVPPPVTSQEQTWLTPSLIAALGALLFAIVSFWFLHARRGRLQSFEPHTFAAYISREESFLRVPIVIYNTGAKPIVVQDLRLKFPQERSVRTMRWRTNRFQISPAEGENTALPAVFAVPGRAAHQLFMEFSGTWPGGSVEARDYKLRIEAKIGHRKKWQNLLAFTLRAERITNPDSYIAYSNRPPGTGE